MKSPGIPPPSQRTSVLRLLPSIKDSWLLPQTCPLTHPSALSAFIALKTTRKSFMTPSLHHLSPRYHTSVLHSSSFYKSTLRLLQFVPFPFSHLLLKEKKVNIYTSKLLLASLYDDGIPYGDPSLLYTKIGK